MTEVEKRVRLWADEDARTGSVVRAVRAYLLKCRTHPNTAQDRAEIAAQEGLIRVLKRDPAKFETHTHFRNTVIRAAINWAISEYGRKGKNTPVPLGEYDLADPSTEPEENWTDECAGNLHAALDGLTPEDRELLRLKYVEGWTLDAIAAHTGSTLNKVWYRLNALRDRLRREVQQEPAAGGCETHGRP